MVTITRTRLPRPCILFHSEDITLDVVYDWKFYFINGGLSQIPPVVPPVSPSSPDPDVAAVAAEVGVRRYAFVRCPDGTEGWFDFDAYVTNGLPMDQTGRLLFCGLQYFDTTLEVEPLSGAPLYENATIYDEDGYIVNFRPEDPQYQPFLDRDPVSTSSVISNLYELEAARKASVVVTSACPAAGDVWFRLGHPGEAWYVPAFFGKAPLNTVLEDSRSATAQGVCDAFAGGRAFEKMDSGFSNIKASRGWIRDPIPSPSNDAALISYAAQPAAATFSLFPSPLNPPPLVPIPTIAVPSSTNQARVVLYVDGQPSAGASPLSSPPPASPPADTNRITDPVTASVNCGALYDAQDIFYGKCFPASQRWLATRTANGLSISTTFRGGMQYYQHGDNQAPAPQTVLALLQITGTCSNAPFGGKLHLAVGDLSFPTLLSAADPPFTTGPNLWWGTPASPSVAPDPATPTGPSGTYPSRAAALAALLSASVNASTASTGMVSSVIGSGEVWAVQPTSLASSSQWPPGTLMLYGDDFQADFQDKVTGQPIVVTNGIIFAGGNGVDPWFTYGAPLAVPAPQPTRFRASRSDCWLWQFRDLSTEDVVLSRWNQGGALMSIGQPKRGTTAYPNDLEVFFSGFSSSVPGGSVLFYQGKFLPFVPDEASRNEGKVFVPMTSAQLTAASPLDFVLYVTSTPAPPMVVRRYEMPSTLYWPTVTEQSPYPDSKLLYLLDGFCVPYEPAGLCLYSYPGIEVQDLMEMDAVGLGFKFIQP